jgi:hypothetical protein
MNVRNSTLEVIVTKGDFNSNYTKFDLFVGNQLTKMQGVLIDMFGVKDERRITSEWVRAGRKLIASNYPTGVLNDKDVLNAAYRANEFLLRYTACREKSRFGESMLLCYPICGIPCNWDESTGVLSVLGYGQMSAPV